MFKKIFQFIKKRFDIILLIFGIIVLILIIVETDKDELLKYLNRIGLKLIILQILPLFIFIFKAFGWKYTLGESKNIPFRSLLRAEIVGNAVADLTPLSVPAGEAYKIYFVKDKINKEEAIASTVLANTVHLLSSLFFLVLGLAYLFFLENVPQTFIILAIILISILTIAFLFAIGAQRGGLFKKLFNLLRKIKFLKKSIEKIYEKILEIDRQLIHFYKNKKKDFFKSLFFFLIMRAIHILEIYLILSFMGENVDFWLAVFLNSVTLFTTFSLFFLNQANVELVLTATYRMLGLEGTIGTTLALIRRIRIFVWMFIGLFIIFIHKGNLKKITQPPEEEIKEIKSKLERFSDADDEKR